MAQHDMVVDNATGAAVRADINAALAALFSSNSGPTFPTNPVAGMLFWNTAEDKLYLRNDSAAWIEVAINISGSFLASTGGTITGNLVIDPASNNANLILEKPPGQSSNITGRVGTTARWNLWLGDADPESGANAGSNFSITRYSDAGTAIDSPFGINRATGMVTGKFQLPAAVAHRGGAGPTTIVDGSTAGNPWTKVNLGTLAAANNVGGFTLNNSNLVVPQTGLYHLTASAWITTPTTTGALEVGVAVNQTSGYTPVMRARLINPVANNYSYVPNANRLISLSAGDALTLIAFFGASGASVSDTSTATYLQAVMVAAQ